MSDCHPVAVDRDHWIMLQRWSGLSTCPTGVRAGEPSANTTSAMLKKVRKETRVKGLDRELMCQKLQV